MKAALLVRVTDLRTARLWLHAIDVEEGQRIVARAAGPADDWADDYPFEGDVGAVGAFLRATVEHGEQQPFGYGLAPSARGHGYAAEGTQVRHPIGHQAITAPSRRRIRNRRERCCTNLGSPRASIQSVNSIDDLATLA